MQFYYIPPPQSWYIVFPGAIDLGTGPTTGRPVNPPAGSYYADTTLGYPVWWINEAWVNMTGAPAP